MTDEGTRKPPSIGAISAFLAKTSDFSFEMKMKQILTSIDDEMSFSGSYTDPVSGKQRQYDFQCRVARADTDTLVIFCVEAKNIKIEKPVVVHQTKRLPRECFSNYILGQGSAGGTSFAGPTIKRIMNNTQLISADAFVGRSFDQFGEPGKEEHLYDKFSQATNHAGSLLRSDRKLFQMRQKAIVLVPVVAIPNNALWVIDYDETGRTVQEPRLEPMTPYYIGSDWECEYRPPSRLKYCIGHTFICTEGKLAELLNELSAPMPAGLAISYLQGTQAPNNNSF